jgi:hypothetical protein
MTAVASSCTTRRTGPWLCDPRPSSRAGSITLAGYAGRTTARVAEPLDASRRSCCVPAGPGASLTSDDVDRSTRMPRSTSRPSGTRSGFRTDPAPNRGRPGGWGLRGSVDRSRRPLQEPGGTLRWFSRVLDRLTLFPAKRRARRQGVCLKRFVDEPIEGSTSGFMENSSTRTSGAMRRIPLNSSIFRVIGRWSAPRQSRLSARASPPGRV